MLSTAKPSDKVKHNLEKLTPRHSTPEALYVQLAIQLMCNTTNSQQLPISLIDFPS